MVCERDRVEYGLNNQDIVYIKIKDLTKEEHDDFMKTLKENDVEIERKTSEVEKVLEESEETEDISIVQASMIGSRGWGYEDKESDIDIRFIFVRDPRDYISILQHEDSIAYPIEDKKDIVGYDLGKFLRMICNQNPTAYEILFSPKQERENQFVERLRQFATEVMDPNKMIMIYQNVVREKLEELSVKKENTTKASIYIIRMLGIIHYMEQNGTFPTCSIEDIFKDESNTPLKQLLEELIEYKRNGQKDLKIHPELIEFLKNDLEKTRGIKVNKEVKDKKEMERKANDLFQQTVMEAQRIKHQEEMEKVSDSERKTEEEEAVYK
jgi:predicted nucleotidyltransferase